MTRKKQRVVMLDDGQWEEATGLAVATGVSRSAIVRRGLALVAAEVEISASAEADRMRSAGEYVRRCGECGSAGCGHTRAYGNGGR